MPSPLADLFEALLKNLTDRLALGAVLVCSILLIPMFFLETTTVGVWAKDHAVGIYLVLLGSLCYLPTRHLIEWIDSSIAFRKHTKSIRKKMESLGGDDCSLLYNPINARQLAFQTGGLHYHIAKSLEKRGIVFAVSDNGHAGSFTIDQEAFNYLIEHPELVGIKKGQ